MITKNVKLGKCQVFMSAPQNLVGGVDDEKIQYDLIEYDTKNEFNIASNSYIAKSEGVRSVVISWRVGFLGLPTPLTTNINVNGVHKKSSLRITKNADNSMLCGSVYLKKGDILSAGIFAPAAFVIPSPELNCFICINELL